MRTMENWTVARSGAGMVIRDRNRPYYSREAKQTKVSAIECREGKIIATTVDWKGEPEEIELLPPVDVAKVPA